MIRIAAAALAALAGIAAVPATAQEVLVTGTRADVADDLDFISTSMPIVAMRRTADFAVQEVALIGDTREQDKRREEMFAMVKSAIALAEKHGVELATGDFIVEPLTLANYRNLPLGRDSRPDTERMVFIVKAKLVPGADAKAALDRITRYIKAVPPVGRAQMDTIGDLTLSVVNPDQYREAIIGLIADDARKTAGRFGDGYGVEVKGLDRPVEWRRAGLTDVFLYLPAAYTVLPRP